MVSQIQEPNMQDPEGEGQGQSRRGAGVVRYVSSGGTYDVRADLLASDLVVDDHFDSRSAVREGV